MRKETRYKIINKAIIIYKLMELISSQYCMAALRIKAERKKCCRYWQIVIIQAFVKVSMRLYKYDLKGDTAESINSVVTSLGDDITGKNFRTNKSLNKTADLMKKRRK